MSSTLDEFAAVLNHAEKKVDARPVWLRTDESSENQRERETNPKSSGNGRGHQKKRG